jgi:hypothetical protein
MSHFQFSFSQALFLNHFFLHSYFIFSPVAVFHHSIKSSLWTTNYRTNQEILNFRKPSIYCNSRKPTSREPLPLCKGCDGFRNARATEPLSRRDAGGVSLASAATRRCLSVSEQTPESAQPDLASSPDHISGHLQSFFWDYSRYWRLVCSIM